MFTVLLFYAKNQRMDPHTKETTTPQKEKL